MPPGLADIRKLPGIGRYTAGAISTFAFDAPEPIVDANIARVLARLLNIRAPVDSKAGLDILWKEAAALQPGQKARLYNSALMELGALICLPRSPKCAACPVQKYCSCIDPGSLPVKNPRRKTVQLSENSAWIVKGDSILLEQQSGTRWRGLWKLPEILPSSDTALNSNPEPILRLTYPFTHHRVTLSILPQAAPQTLAAGQNWCKIHKLPQLAITAPHRRAIEQLLALRAKSSLRSKSIA
jgi:A/G-specific adenine glycosylase